MIGNDSEDRLLLAKAEDALRLAEQRCAVKVLGFLNPRQRVLIQNEIMPPMGVVMEFFGGYADAERTLMVCYPDFMMVEKEELVTILHCTGRDADTLSHRDYLGSLMNLGIVRESVGDILVQEKEAFLFVKPENGDYIQQNLTKIGRCGIHVTFCKAEETVIPEKAVKEIGGTVSALRLDCVVAMALNASRSRVAQWIAAGSVQLNWESTEKGDSLLHEGDIISVRGFGRMKLVRIGGTTRKGRTSITVVRYI